MSKVRAVGRVAALAGMLVASAGVFAGVSHADSDHDGPDGRDGTGHAKCKRGFLGLPVGRNQCTSRDGARDGEDDRDDERPRYASRGGDDELTREELSESADGDDEARGERQRDPGGRSGGGAAGAGEHGARRGGEAAGADEHDGANRDGRAGQAGLTSNERRIGRWRGDRDERDSFAPGSRGSYTNVYDSALDTGGGYYDGSAY